MVSARYFTAASIGAALVVLSIFYIVIHGGGAGVIDIAYVHVNGITVYNETYAVNYALEIMFDVSSDVDRVEVESLSGEVYVVSGDTRVYLGGFSRGPLTWRGGKNLVRINDTGFLSMHRFHALRALYRDNSIVVVNVTVHIVYRVGSTSYEATLHGETLPANIRSVIVFS